MISRIRSFSLLSVCASLALVLAVLLPAGTYAQSVRIARVGVLSAGPPPSPTAPAPPTREALLRGLHELGWIEGQNIAFEYRYADWQVERLPDLAGELVRANVDHHHWRLPAGPGRSGCDAVDPHRRPYL